MDLERLYGEVAPIARRVALGILGDRHRAEDIAHDVFLQTVRAMPQFKGASRLSTWVYRVTVNQCINFMRRERRRPSVEEAAARRREEPHGEILSLLESIDPLFRAPVMLKDVEELTYEEIAEVLGVPVGTAMSRVARGRERLRALVLRNESARPVVEGGGGPS